MESTGSNNFPQQKILNFNLNKREDFEVPVIQKLSISFSQEYPFRDVADSRDPEEEKYCESRGDNDERTATSPRSSQDIFISPTAMSKMSPGSSEPSTPNLWSSMSSLKRANPIYESDAEYEDADYSYSNSMRKINWDLNNPESVSFSTISLGPKNKEYN